MTNIDARNLIQTLQRLRAQGYAEVCYLHDDSLQPSEATSTLLLFHCRDDYTAVDLLDGAEYIAAPIRHVREDEPAWQVSLGGDLYLYNGCGRMLGLADEANA